VGELGVVVDKLRGHRQVARHLLRVLLAQSLQLIARRVLQILRGDLFGNDRVIVTRTIFGPTIRTLAAGTPALREAAAVALIAAFATLVAAFATLAVTTRSSTITTLITALTAVPITTRSSTITTLVAALTTLITTLTAVAITTRSSTITTRGAGAPGGRRAIRARPPRAVSRAVVVVASRAALVVVRHVLILSTLLLTQNGHPALGGHFD